MNDKCLFCKIIKNELPSAIIWENDKYLAFLDINPINEGHTLLIPKIHVEDVFDLTEEDYKEIFVHAKSISSRIKAAIGSKRIGLAVEGLAVPHVHIHLIPINNVGDLNPLKAKPASKEDLIRIANKIKVKISDK